MHPSAEPLATHRAPAAYRVVRTASITLMCIDALAIGAAFVPHAWLQSRETRSVWYQGVGMLTGSCGCIAACIWLLTLGVAMVAPGEYKQRACRITTFALFTTLVGGILTPAYGS